MHENVNRRQFLQQAGLSALVISSAVSRIYGLAKPAGLRIAYSAITWGGNDTQAITDISGLGYKGIQLRANAFGPYKAKPSELKALLDQHHLTLAMFSSPLKNRVLLICTWPTPVS